MKKIALSILLLSSIPASIKTITFESPIIDFIDGKSYGVNEMVFALLLQVRREIRQRLFGQKLPSGTYKGMYKLEDKHYSIVELALLESQLDAKHFANEITEEEYKSTKNKLQSLLTQALDDLLDITKDYMSGLRGAKEQVLILINEFCEKRKLPNSLLLGWAKEKDGQEGVLLRKKVDTFVKYEKFCQELALFMEDFARSCPKAKKQFLAMIKKNNT